MSDSNTITSIIGSVKIGEDEHKLTFVKIPGVKKPVLRTYDKPELALPFLFEDTALRQAHVATAMSTVDGEGDGVEGKLLYRGHNIKELVQKTSYEEVSHLLLMGTLPNQEQLGGFKQKLAEYAILKPDIREQLMGVLKAIKVTEHTDPMSLLSTLVSIMDGNEKLSLKGEEKRYESDLRTMAVMPTLIGLVNAHMHHKLDEFSFPAAQDFGANGKDFSYAKMLMRALNPANADDPAKVSALDKYLTLHAEHGLNLSTATARAVDSGESKEGVWRITLGAMQSLAGNRHGNASNDALSNLKSILKYNGGQGSIEERVDAYINDVEAGKAAKGEKPPREYKGQLGQVMDGTIEGLGHKIYQAKDPRASALQGILKDCNADSDLLKVALTLEARLAEHPMFGKKHDATGGKAKNIFPNVDFCSGVLLTQYLGIDERLMTSMFAVGRNVGWQAHAAENARHTKNIVRPEAIPLTPEAPVPEMADRTPPTQVQNARASKLFEVFKTLGLAA